MFKDILKTPDALRNAILGQDDISTKSNQGLQAVRSGVDSLKTVLANHQHAKDALQQQQLQQASPPTSFLHRHSDGHQAVGLDGRPPTPGVTRSTSFPSMSRSGTAFTRSLAGTVTESLKSIGTGLGLNTTNNTSKGKSGREERQTSGQWEAERSVPRDRDTRRSMDSSSSGPLSLLARIQHASSSSSLSSSSSAALLYPSYHHHPSSDSTESEARLEGTSANLPGSSNPDRISFGWSSTSETLTAAKATAQRLANVRAKDTTTFNIQRMPNVEQLARRYHDSWIEIHDHTAKNAAKAEQTDALLEKVLAACERHVQASTQLWQEAKSLESLDSTMSNIMAMTENIHKKLSGLEEAIEKLELDAEVVQFADWKKDRVNELDRYMDTKRKEMWDKAELLAARSQEYQREESQRRLKMIEEQFASDMDEFRRRKYAEEAKLFGTSGENNGYGNGSVSEYGDHVMHGTDKRSSTSSIGIPGLMTPKEFAATTKELAATTKGFFKHLSSTLSTTSVGHIPTSNPESSRSSVVDVAAAPIVGTMAPLPTIPQPRRSAGTLPASVRNSILFVDNVQPEEADQEALDQFLGSDSGSSDEEEHEAIDKRPKQPTPLSNKPDDHDDESSSEGGIELAPEEDIEDNSETSDDEEEDEDEEEESEDSDSDDGMDPIARARLAQLGMRLGHKSGSTIALFSIANASKTQLPS